MITGKVKFFNASKGFGFITPEEGGDDVFFHITAFEQAGLPEPKQGDKVMFEIEKSQRTGKPQAANLQQG